MLGFVPPIKEKKKKRDVDVDLDEEAGSFYYLFIGYNFWGNPPEFPAPPEIIEIFWRTIIPFDISGEYESGMWIRICDNNQKCNGTTQRKGNFIRNYWGFFLFFSFNSFLVSILNWIRYS